MTNKEKQKVSVVFASSEVYPFSKTGGLADMAYSLPKELTKKGQEVVVITPLYSKFINYSNFNYLGNTHIYILGRDRVCDYYETYYEGVRIIFVYNEELFGRNYLYGGYDEAERFIFFDYAVLESIRVLNLNCQILHLNDWQTALIAYLLDEQYRRLDYRYFLIRAILTIHNLAFQGEYSLECNKMIGIYHDYTYEHFGYFNMLKAGIIRSSVVNTVSPTYKEEIKTKEYGFTLDGDLRYRENSLFGILNGIDYETYNPKTDTSLYKNYQKPYYVKGKEVNKLSLLRTLGLYEHLDAPLICFISRLTDQKGVSLVIDTIKDMLNYSYANFIIIGSGNKNYEEEFNSLAYNNPKRVSVYIGFSESLARKAYAGSDMIIIPSLFEPCGLTQMIGCRYGTIPIVRETGGLKDSIKPYNVFDIKGCNGFTFKNFNYIELKDTIYRALDVYYNNKVHWNKLVLNAMNKNFSLNNVCKNYLNLYKKVLKEY